jgi:hypothetical protein
MKKVVGAVSALALGFGVVALPANASADPVTGSEVCSPLSAGVCGAAAFWLSNSGADQILNVAVYNSSTVKSSLTQIYLFSEGLSLSFVGATTIYWDGTSQISSPMAGWTWGTTNAEKQGWMAETWVGTQRQRRSDFVRAGEPQ